ncbi:MAG: valine--pyruvate transaminase [Arenicellales bacterium]
MSFSNFASRLSNEAGIISLMEDLGAAMSGEETVYMLGGGNPSHIPELEQYFRHEMLAIASDVKRFGKMVGDYDGPQGNQYFIEVLAEYFSEQFGWDISAENIAITNGSQASFGLLFNTLAGEFKDNAFKQVLLPLTPEYIGYSDVGLSDKNLFTAAKPIIEHIDDTFFKYRVDFEQAQLNDDIGAMCVSRPTNPTGNVITDNEIKQLAKLSKASQTPFIIDSAYGLPFPNMVFTDAKPIWDEHIVLCFSLSKLGLPGVRTGIIVAAPDLIERVRNANAIFSLAPGSVGPALVAEAIRSRALNDLCTQHLKPYYLKKRDAAIAHIKTQMHDVPVKIHQPEGAIFLWLWFDGLPISVQTLYERLKARKVLIIAGHHFFPGLEEDWQHKHECIRMTYSSDAESVEQGIAIIAEEVRLAFGA